MRRLAFTPENEEFVRGRLFVQWEIYWTRRRLRILERLSNPHLPAETRRELRGSRWFRSPAPVDLSGGCRLAALVASQVFAFAGQVHSNSHHTFIFLRGGEIYDLNRYCRDVNTMRIYEDEPHRLDYAYSRSLTGVAARASWKHYLHTTLADLAQFTATMPDELFHVGPPLEKLPSWGKVPREPSTEFGEWQFHIKELRHGQSTRSRRQTEGPRRGPRA